MSDTLLPFHCGGLPVQDAGLSTECSFVAPDAVISMFKGFGADSWDFNIPGKYREIPLVDHCKQLQQRP